MSPVAGRPVDRRVPSSNDQTETVRSGDSLQSIAARHDVSPEALLKANPQIRDAKQLPAGMQLTIPPRCAPRGTNGRQGQETAAEPQGPPASRFSGKAFESALEGQVRSVMIGQARVQAAPQQSGGTASLSMVDRMKKDGMQNVSDPPSDAQLREYYQKYAPAHDLIAKGDYSAAAAKYRELKLKDGSPFATYDTIERQLTIASSMQNKGVKDVQFPPSEQNAKDYFKKLGKQDPPLPTAGILKMFENYSKAFYHHEGRDIVYDTKQKKVGKDTYDAKSPESWKEISDQRSMFPQGTRKIDCEGYAYLASELLGQAGMKNGKFVVVGPKDDPSTTENESNKAHIMFTAQHGDETIVVSNDKTYHGPREDREKMIDLGYPPAAGGPQVEDSVAWKASYKYEKL